jgi:hypothetical protein
MQINLKTTTGQISSMVEEWASKKRYSEAELAATLKEYNSVISGREANVLRQLRNSSFGRDILLASMWLARYGGVNQSLLELGRTSPVEIKDEDYSNAFQTW